jgi:hypothetical protein
VFRAKAGRLLPPESIAASAPPPRPTGAIELPPLDDDDLDLAIPPGHVFPAQRNADILRTLSWAGVWMRIVAAADVLSVFVVMAVFHMAQHRRGIDDGEGAVVGMLCGLILVAPAAVCLWVVGSGLMQVRLRGSSQQVGLMGGLASGVLGGILTLFALRFTLEEQRRAGSLDYVALVIMGTMALATGIVTGVAVVARRQAIAAGIAERISDMQDAGDADLGVPPALLPYRSPQKIIRSAARSLRLASSILVLWYPLNWCCCASMPPHHPGGSPELLVILMAACLTPLVLMLAGAHYLEQQRRRGVVIAGSIAALMVSVGFGIDCIVGLVQLARPHGAQLIPLLLLSSAVALMVALSNLIGGIQTWQAVHDRDVRRLFARNQ